MVENEQFLFHVSNKKRPSEVGLASSDGVKLGTRDNWKILNREKNNKLERERKQRLTIALKELQSLLPSEHISGIIQKLAIQHPTRNSKSNQYPNYLIAEAIVDYVGELQNFVLEHPKHVNNTSIDVAEISIQTESKISSDISIQTLETSRLCSSTQTPQISSKDAKSTQTEASPVLKQNGAVQNVTQTRESADSKTKVKSNWVPCSVPESPMKNSFNIHSLIGSDPFPSVPDALNQVHSSSNQISNHSINHAIQVPKPTQNHAAEVKQKQSALSSDKNHQIANNWQPWSTTGTSTESKNNNSISDKINVMTAVISSSTKNSTQNSIKVGTKRKANHLIEHVVGTQPSLKSSYRHESKSKDTVPVRTDNPVGTSRGITFPEPKLGVHKLKTSKSAQIWSHVSSTETNKKTNSNQQAEHRSSSRLEDHTSRQNTTTNASSVDQRTGATERLRQNDRTERSNIDQINFSINSLFADMNTMDDPFTLVSQSASQSKRQNGSYNQGAIGAPNQPTMFDEDQTRWANDWCFGPYFHDGTSTLTQQTSGPHSIGFHYAHTTTGGQQTLFDHSIDFPYNNRHSSSHNTTHNISQILQHNST